MTTKPPPNQPTPEQRAGFAEFLSDKPPTLQAAARTCPPWHCYRSTDNPGHYKILAYAENGSVRLAHGADSYMPGMAVFGVDTKTLTVCDCGQWQPPTEEQLRHMQAHLDSLEKARAAAPPPLGLDLPGLLFGLEPARPKSGKPS